MGAHHLILKALLDGHHLSLKDVLGVRHLSLEDELGAHWLNLKGEWAGQLSCSPDPLGGALEGWHKDYIFHQDQVQNQVDILHKYHQCPLQVDIYL